MITMGNLFSGSGAWELAARMCGIEVLFEAEIEPFPVAVEKKRFPNAVQLGDVSKIKGADIPSVDIFTNSSPCQDLSVAGKRAGLEGQRSGLFAEAIRITKEMREHDKTNRGPDEHIRPRFWCWENVPGAFSSNKGEDFRIVLEEVARIADPSVAIPFPESGKWEKSGVVDGEGWQIAWRTMDAQYFGVPQRRRRIFLVADFNGGGAAEVLFERKSMSWHFAEIADTWKDTSRSLEDRIACAGEIINRSVRKAKSGVDELKEKN